MQTIQTTRMLYLVAKTGIKKGDELLVDYGFGYWGADWCPGESYRFEDPQTRTPLLVDYGFGDLVDSWTTGLGIL